MSIKTVISTITKKSDDITVEVRKTLNLSSNNVALLKECVKDHDNQLCHTWLYDNEDAGVAEDLIALGFIEKLEGSQSVDYDCIITDLGIDFVNHTC